MELCLQSPPPPRALRMALCPTRFPVPRSKPSGTCTDTASQIKCLSFSYQEQAPSKCVPCQGAAAAPVRAHEGGATDALAASGAWDSLPRAVAQTGGVDSCRWWSTYIYVYAHVKGSKATGRNQALMLGWCLGWCKMSTSAASREAWLQALSERGWARDAAAYGAQTAELQPPGAARDCGDASVPKQRRKPLEHEI